MKNNYTLANYTPVHITGETIDFVLRELGSEALALYVAYAGIAQWQNTRTVKATTLFMANRMKWSEDKLRKVKKLLLQNGYIEDITKKDSDNKVKGWYIKINYVVKSHTVENARGWENPECGKKGGQVLYKETSSAFKETSSALERKQSIKEDSLDLSELFPEEKKPSVTSNEVSVVIEYFNELFGTRYRVTPDRSKKIRLRLKTYTLEEIKTAITKCKASKFHTGENDRSWKAGIDYIVRNDEIIDQFLNAQQKPERPYFMSYSTKKS